MRSILLLLIAGIACACGPRTLPDPPEPVPAPAPVAARTPPPTELCEGESAVHLPCIHICFVENGRLRAIPLTYNRTTQDSLTRDGRPLTQVVQLTGEYASVAGWYVRGEAIAYRGEHYVKYGLPRVLGSHEVEQAGEYRGVPVFVEAESTDSIADYLYLPTRPGCEFQPYTITAPL